MPYVGRQPTPSPVTADDIPDNSIDASKIVDGAIAVADVADNAITEDKIADAAVVSLKSGRKNLIINGGFDVWQRGTSFTANSDTFGADRWAISRPDQTVTKQSATIGDVRCYSLKAEKTASGSMTAYHSIENPLDFNGKTLTLSFYAKSNTSLTNSGQAWVYYNNGANSFQVGTFTDTFTTSWVKYTHTFTMPTNLEVYANTHSLNISLLRALSASSGDSAEIAQVQLELGSVATEFEHRSYGEELALCQRYYQKGPTSATYPGFSNGTSMVYFTVPLTTPLRASPTLTRSGGGNWYALKHNGHNSSNNTPEVVSYASEACHIGCRQTGHSGLSDMYATNIYVSSYYIIFDAEL